VHNVTSDTTGSSSADSTITAEHRFTHRLPSIMHLATFGCRAVVLKPPPHQRKGDLSTRGWLGVYCGNSSQSIGCVDVYVHELGRFVTSSAALLNEEEFPWLGKESHKPLRATKHVPPQPVQAPLGPPAPPVVGPPTFASAADINAPPAKILRMLIISSEKGSRPLELAKRLVSFGWSSVRQAGSDKASDGCWASCLDNDSAYSALSAAARNGEFEGVLITAGDMPVAERALEIANLARASASAATIVISHARANSSALTSPAFRRLRSSVGPNSTCSFAMCRFQLPAQVYTTLWYTNDAAGALDPLGWANYQCNHPAGSHPLRMGGASDSSNIEGEAVATNDRFNIRLASAFNTARTGSPQPFTVKPPPPPVVPVASIQLNPAAPAWAPDAPPSPSLGAASPTRSPSRSSSTPSPAGIASPVNFSGFNDASNESYVPFDPNARPAVQGRAERSVRQGTRILTDESTKAELDCISRRMAAVPETETDALTEDLLAFLPADAKELMEASVAEIIYDAHVDARPELTALGPWTNINYDQKMWALISSSSAVTKVSSDTLVLDATRAAKDLAKQAYLSEIMTSQPMPRAHHAMLLEELKHVELALRADSSGAPSTHAEATEWGPPWPEAMDKEMNNHAVNETWVKIHRDQLPRGRRVHKFVWVFKLKRDGSAKGRLCVQGCSLQGGVDFDQTFSQTLRHSSARAIFAYAARKGLAVRSIDYVAAYLQGQFTAGEVVYCHMPPGHEEVDSNGHPFYLRVEKPVYGIPQAGRRLQRMIFPWLEEIGLRQLTDSDGCVWVYDDPKGEESFVLGVYVDNLQVAHSALLDPKGKPVDPDSFYAKFLSKLIAEWDVVDEGPMEDLLAIQLQINNDGSYTLHQEAYILKLLAKYMPNGPPPHVQRNSLPYSDNLSENIIAALSIDGASASAPAYPELVRPFQERIGSLMYLSTATRCDITYSVHQLARAMAQPTPELMGEIDHVLAYLSRHSHVGLTFDAGRAKPFEGFSDASWDVRFSTSGWIVCFQGCAVTWGSTKQNCVALSSCESEIIALSEAAKDMVYFRKLFKGIDAAIVPGPTNLSSDNMAARDLAYNPEHHARTKHVERRHFYIRDMVEKFELNVPYVNTHDNIADFLTKTLASKRFFYLRKLIMNEPGPRDRA
jgi:hypothetical protein